MVHCLRMDRLHPRRVVSDGVASAAVPVDELRRRVHRHDLQRCHSPVAVLRHESRDHQSSMRIGSGSSPTSATTRRCTKSSRWPQTTPSCSTCSRRIEMTSRAIVRTLRLPTPAGETRSVFLVVRGDENVGVVALRNESERRWPRGARLGEAEFPRLHSGRVCLSRSPTHWPTLGSAGLRCRLRTRWTPRISAEWASPAKDDRWVRDVAA